MPREGFHRRIKELEDKVLEMGEMVFDAIHRSVEALKTLDTEKARQVITNDAQVDRKRWQLEDRCVDLIATQQPVASDLREIIATLSIVRDLERIGDYAEGIGKIVLMHGDEPLVKPLMYLLAMTEKAVGMLAAAWRPSSNATPKPPGWSVMRMMTSTGSMIRPTTI